MENSIIFFLLMVTNISLSDEFEIETEECKPTPNVPAVTHVSDIRHFELAEGGSSWIQCENDGILQIIEAKYGEESRFCGIDSHSIYKVSGIIHKKCERKNRCLISASNSFMGGDPCYLVLKKFKMKYTCSHVEVKKKIFCEHAEAHLNCNNSEKINIINAVYGRVNNNSPCGNEIKNCSSDTSLANVVTICDNKSQCSFTVNNDLFGDPCPFVFKEFIATYECIKDVPIQDPPNITEIGTYTVSLELNSLIHNTPQIFQIECKIANEEIISGWVAVQSGLVRDNLIVVVKNLIPNTKYKLRVVYEENYERNCIPTVTFLTNHVIDIRTPS